MAEELTFHLADFEGPLELLLTLVQKHKMDLHNIPILELIDQYTRTVAADAGSRPGDGQRLHRDGGASGGDEELSAAAPQRRGRADETGTDRPAHRVRPVPPDGRGIARKGEQAPVFVRRPLEVEQDNTYDLFHSPQVLADCWQALAGRKAAVVRQPTQQQFEPLVSAPVVSVNSRVVYILRQLIGGSARKLGQLFSRRQSRSTHVATFLALLELVRGGRVTLGPDGAMTMRRGRPWNAQRRTNEPEKTASRRGGDALCLCGDPVGRRQTGRRRFRCRSPAWRPVLEELRTRYAREDSGLCLLHLNTHWQLATKADWAEPRPPGAGHPALGAAGPGGDGDADRHRLQPAGLPRIH